MNLLSCTVNPESVFPLFRFVPKHTELSRDYTAKHDQKKPSDFHNNAEKLSSCEIRENSLPTDLWYKPDI